jgi:putative aldouronate transport system substrate-binding protein
MFMQFTSDDQNTMAVAQANINNIIDNQWSIWMYGQSDVEADWDAYVQSVYDAGLQQVLDIRQAAYDAYMAK